MSTSLAWTLLPIPGLAYLLTQLGQLHKQTPGLHKPKPTFLGSSTILSAQVPNWKSPQIFLFVSLTSSHSALYVWFCRCCCFETASYHIDEAGLRFTKNHLSLPRADSQDTMHHSHPPYVFIFVLKNLGCGLFFFLAMDQLTSTLWLFQNSLSKSQSDLNEISN